MNKMSPCLWFNNQAEEAAKYYSTVFKNVKIKSTSHYGESAAKVSGQKAGTPMVVDLDIEDINVQALNGGPMFRFTPALSFYVTCESDEEIKEKWGALSEGGNVRMALDKYPWAEKYAWTSDRFGVEWQLILAPKRNKIVPAFLFVDSLFGKGEEAINFYISIFPDSKIDSIVRDYSSKSIMHCSFTLNGQGFVLMEGQGNHGYTFSHAFSMMVKCQEQAEIDRYWKRLSDEGTMEQCGWLKDKFGVSWQIVPANMAQFMADPARGEKAMAAVLKMKKLDIAEIEKAANS